MFNLDLSLKEEKDGELENILLTNANLDRLFLLRFGSPSGKLPAATTLSLKTAMAL